MTIEALRNAVIVDGLVIVEETGEVLEWPDGESGPAEKAAALVRQMRECTAQKAAWEARAAVLKAAAARLLADEGLDRLDTAYGRLSRSTREYVAKERWPKLVERAEITMETLAAIVLASVSQVSAPKFTAAAYEAGISAEHIADCLYTTESVEAREIARAAPRLDSRLVETTED